MEIHISMSHFQENNVSQPTFPALSVGEKKNSWKSRAERGHSHILLDNTGGKKRAKFPRFWEKAFVLYWPSQLRRKQKVDVRSTRISQVQVEGFLRLEMRNTKSGFTTKIMKLWAEGPSLTCSHCSLASYFLFIMLLDFPQKKLSSQILITFRLH